MQYQNTTNIPDKLVALALAFSMPQGVELRAMRLRNKPFKSKGGNWGMYYARQRKITLNVPRVINPDRIRRRPYTKAEYKLNSRVEWLVMTIAHELRHAYQDQVTNTLYSRVSRKAMERDAERFELAQLEKWREWTKEQGL